MPRLIDAETPPSRRLAQAAKVTETVISRELYRTGSLRADCERLSQPSEPMTDADILSFVLKYFHASLYPGSENHAVPLAEASGLLPVLRSVAGRRRAGRALARGLQRLSAPHAGRSAAHGPYLPVRGQPGPGAGAAARALSRFDLGTGSGIILTAAWFQAMRNKIHDTELVGVECDGEVAERTRLCLIPWGLAGSWWTTPGTRACWRPCPTGPWLLWATKTCRPPRPGSRPNRFRPFMPRCFRSCPGGCGNHFLSRSLGGAGQGCGNRRGALEKQPVPAAAPLSGSPAAAPVHRHRGASHQAWQVGKDFRQYLPESWLQIMPGRW